jgi:hypothetical protein
MGSGFLPARTADEKAHAESDTENMRESLRVSGIRGYWENSLRIIQVAGLLHRMGLPQ